MKTVVLMGSPNKKGHTMTVVNELEKEMGGDFVYYNPYSLSFSPCNDCEYCHKKEGCCIQDDVQDMYKDLRDADNVIVASPMYFGMISGPLLSLLSRLQFCFSNTFHLKMKDPFKRKRGIFIMTAAQSWFNMYSPCRDTMKFIFDHMNAEHTAEILVENTDTVAVSEQPEVFKKIKDTAALLRFLGAAG
ncbi:MAG: flavodoxin family protein [Spirochaetales bacterium]|nr:flavodoxin family protein [Spirochaetales bacterium]